MQQQTSKKLPWSAKLSFGMGGFGKDAVYAIVSTFLLYYLVTVRGVSGTFVGTLFLVARIFDAVNDPLMGVIVDNTRSKWGRFRPWIMLGTVLNSVVLILLYFNNSLSGTSYMAYIAVLYILWGLTYTFEDIPYWSMVPSLSEDPLERDQVTSFARFCTSFAWMVVGSGGYVIMARLAGVDKLPDATDDATRALWSSGFSRFAVIIAIVFVITALILCVKCREVRQVPKSAEKTSVKQMLNILFKNDQVLAMLGIALCFNLGYQLENAFATFYFQYVTGNKDMFSVYTGVASIAQMATLLLFPTIAMKIGRPKTFLAAAVTQIVGFFLLLACGFICPASTVMVVLCSAIINIGIGFMLVLVTVSLADVVDYGEYKFGTRNEAIIFSMQTFIVKLAGAVSGFISGVGLDLIGFKSELAQQSGGTIIGMRVIMIVLPAALALITYLVYLKGYKLRGPFLDKVKAAIAAKED